MKITVIGCGRWGSFIAWYLNKIGNDVTLYGRESSKKFQQFKNTRTNGMIELPESIKLSSDLAVTQKSEIIVISVGAQVFRNVLEELKEYNLKDKIFVLCMKGIEIESTERLSEIAEANVDYSNRIAVWLGPGHVQEFYRGVPNCMVIDSKNEACKKFLVEKFTSPLIRFYYGNDLLGNEIGAAAKNVIGIAAGALDGLGLTSLKGALMSRGTREVSRLIEKMGGNPFSAYGLCHLGDYEATVFSQFSNNRKFGESLVKGEKFDKLAEGYYTSKAMMKLKEEYKVDLPITEAVYNVCFNKRDAKEEIENLFLRSIKNEFA
ncbi:NAD(P)H-dependent glycerol-3-phosphate dehydrogenase [Miniphocaeibacter halophilus]|uniref:NAD(P)H-dependent glycerol-3-phosphate dehydrogenase n=1 Tax=Miniphocaeibacter halophilus TaxID=2931922 RepID=A0AC61MP46_9FIRM|nr:NAD(P)H-dependent glycerol-3-phosphate dehydrogenase [Miniphocaeibacter halophilus]QQK07300.1 NAD(P)H-dependent glycerol-3-phosphate dehydrogenase [Miniphocaeibacter halophilus]